MELKELLGDDLGAQVEKAISDYNTKPENKEKPVKFADLSTGAYVSSEKYKALEGEKGGIAEQYTAAQKMIDELKKGTAKDTELQGKIGEYETKMKTLQAENEKLKTESALKVVLLNAGAKPSDMDYLLFKAGQSGNIKLGEDGKLKGQDDLISGLKTQCPAQFQSAEQKSIQEHKLEQGDQHNQETEPKTLAEALKMQYESNTKTE